MRLAQESSLSPASSDFVIRRDKSLPKSVITDFNGSQTTVVNTEAEHTSSQQELSVPTIAVPASERVCPSATLNPISSKEVCRYHRGFLMPKRESEYKVEILSVAQGTNLRVISHERQTPSLGGTCLPSGWEPYTHPEGALYFFHKEQRVYTDANLYDREYADTISELMCCLTRKIEATRQMGVDIPEDYETVLEPPKAEDPSEDWGYYFVDHVSQSLFWTDSYHPDEWLREIAGETNRQHLHKPSYTLL